MLRNTLSVLAGLVTAIIVFVVAEQINHQLHPFPTTLELGYNQATADYMQTVPILYWLIVLGGWALGSLLAGFIIQKISSTDKSILPLIAGVILTLSSIANLFAIKHPIWFSVFAVVMFIPLVSLGNSLAKKKNFLPH